MSVRALLESNGIGYAVVGDKFYTVTTAGVVTERGTLGTDSGPLTMESNGLQIGIADGTLYVYDIAAETFGAVSIACAWAMAHGALKHSRADIAVSISGIAGPDGGSREKPVGTVVFARAIRGEEDATAEEKRFEPGSRADVRLQAALVALELLLP